eukprot:Em0018g687a
MSGYTVVLGGRYGVGKTSIFLRLMNKDIADATQAEGVDRYTYKTTVNGKPIEAYVWDTGGVEKHSDCTANYYRNSHAIILVYDMTDEVSLYALKEWLTDAKKYSYNVMPVMWGNKEDVIEVPPPGVAAFMEENDIPPSLHFKVSAKTGRNIREALDATLKALEDRASAMLCRGGKPPQQDSDVLPKLSEPKLKDCAKHRCCQ